MKPYSHSNALFVTKDGAPMRFYVRPGPSKRQLAPLITHGGGVMCRIQEPGSFLLADPTEGQLGPGYLSTTYVTDCVSKNHCLSPRAYRLISTWDLKTGAGQKSPVSKRTDGGEVHKETEDHQGVDLTNNTPKSKKSLFSLVTTFPKGIGNKEHVMKQKGDLNPERARKDGEAHQERSAVDLTNKTDVHLNKEAFTSTVIITEGATDQIKDSVGHAGIKDPKRVPGKEKGHSSKNDISKSSIPTGTASGSKQDLKTVFDATNEDECINEGNSTTAHITKSGFLKSLNLLDKRIVEQTLNEDENFSLIESSRPATSTPVPENPNTERHLETETAHDHVLLKEGVSPLGKQFSRPKRKVADKRRLIDETKSHSPSMKKNRTGESMGETMLVPERLCGQAVQDCPNSKGQISKLEDHGIEKGRIAKSPARQKKQVSEEENGKQKNSTAKELHQQSTKSQQVHGVVQPRSNRASTALQQGRTAFTEKDDLAILGYVRDNICSSLTVTGTVLWKNMAKEMGHKRSWHSLKARYVKYLVYHKPKYKLHTRSLSLLEKMQVSANNNGLCLDPTSIETVQKYDTTVPGSSAVSPQQLDSTNASTDAPQKDNTLPSTASGSTPQKCDPKPTKTSADAPQKRDAMVPNSSKTPQKGDLILLSSSANNQQQRDAMLPSSDAPQEGDHMLLCSADTPQKVVCMQSSSDTLVKCDAIVSNASSDTPQNGNAMIPSSADTRQSVITARKKSSHPSNHIEPSSSKKGVNIQYARLQTPTLNKRH